MNETKTIRGFRQVIQDLLVPELRSIKTEIEYMKRAIDTNTSEIKTLSQKVDKLSDTTLRLVEKFDASMKYTEVMERLAKIEQKLNL